jgi:ribosomal protein S18 acetylase RimI-like enzyme
VSASDAELVAAAVAGHRSWMARGAEVHDEPGVLWTVAPHRLDIAFPELAQSDAGERLDAILAAARAAGVPEAACWSLLPAPTEHLSALLVARGFEIGWQPHWMGLEIEYLPPDRPPAGVEVELHLSDGVHRGVARRGTTVLGTALIVADGAAGSVFDVHVEEAERRQGIGWTLTHRLCAIAARDGVRHVTLNATGDGERLYRAMGFRSLGLGQTWWMHRPALSAPAPPPRVVAYVEAIARGDVAALEAASAALEEGEQEARLLNGRTPLQQAVESAQPATAAWLADHGAQLDVLMAWLLGWRDRAATLLAERPELRERLLEADITPLHAAAEHDDADLARLLLSAGADPTRRDPEFDGTPLDWARHLGHDEVAAVLAEATPGAES